MKINLRIPFVLGLLLIARTVALAQEPERVIQTAHPKDFIEVAFSPDSKILVGAGANWTKFWDARRGKELHSLDRGGHILFSRDGKILAISSLGKTTLWDVRTGKVVHMLDGYVGPFNPDGKILATVAETEITLWDVKTGRQRLLIKGTRWKSGSVRFAFGGRTVGAIDWEPNNVGMKFFDVRSGEQLRTLPAHNIYALSRDGKIWASETDISSIKLWDVATGKEQRRLNDHKGVITGLVCTDGNRVVTSSHDRTFRVWVFDGGKELLRITADVFANGISLSPDGKIEAYRTKLRVSFKYEKE